MNARATLPVTMLLWLGMAGCLGSIAHISYSEGARNTAATTINAAAPKIYAAVLRVLDSNEAETVLLKRDDAHFTIDALKGLQRVTIVVAPEGRNRGRLSVVSDAGKNNSFYTDQALITTQQVCNELGVRYSMK